MRFQRSLALAGAVSLLAVLSGCGGSSMPSGMAQPDSGARLAERPDCPDLRGSFTLAIDARSATLEQEISQSEGMPAPPLLSRTLRIEQQANGQVTVLERLHPDAVNAAALQLKSSDPGAYRMWWRLARRGARLEGDLQRNLQLHFNALAELGPAPERSWVQSYPSCREGWLRIGRSFVPSVDTAGDLAAAGDEVWLTRDREGGLLLRADIELERREITVWCGDGCKGIPYYIRSIQRWRRYPTAQQPPLWSLDVRRLTPLAEPSTSAPMAVAAVEPAPSATAAPRAPAGVSEPHTLLPELQPVLDPRVLPLQERVRGWLANVDQIDRFEQARGSVHFEGRARNNDAVSRILRVLDNDADVLSAELLQVQASAEGRVQFAIVIRLQPRPKS